MATDLTLDKYKKLANQLQSQLYSTPGTTSLGSEPSSRDVQTEIQLIKTKKGLQKVLAEQRAADWYGTPSLTQPPKEQKREGVISKTISLLSTPLYGIVGAVETALGKGTKKKLVENIKSNIQERGTFGDLLRSYNAPRALSIPLGFALDVMFDPINWTIAGSAALIPKIAIGAAKAGLTGAKLGVQTGLAQKAATIGKYTPFLKGTEKFKTFADDAVRLSDEYYKAINSDMVDVLRKTIDNPGWVRRGAESLEQFLNRSKTGQKILELTKYSPSAWYRAAREIASEEKKLLEGTKKFLVGEKVEDVALPITSSGAALLSPILRRLGIKPPAGLLRSEIDDAVDLASGGHKAVKADNAAEVGRRMAGEYEIDQAIKAQVLEKLREVSSIDKTGVRALDDFYNFWRTKVKIGNWKIGEQGANAYNIIISAFKSAVIGLGPAVYPRSIVGNTIFAQMAGMNVTDPNFIKYVIGAWRLIRGKVGSFEKKMLNNFSVDPNWKKYLDDYPSIFSRVFGYHPAFLRGQQGLAKIADDWVRGFKKQGGNIDNITFGRERAEVFSALDRSLRSLKKEGDIARKLRGSASQIVREAGSIGEVGGTTLISSEIYQGAFRKFVDYLEASGAGGNKTAKFFYNYFTKPMDLFESIDQSFKLGTTLLVSQVGVSRRTLEMVKNFMRLYPEDVARVAGKDLYKFLPDAATRTAGEIYMNYGAMPGFVKIMRMLPFLGAPFISFMYAMTAKLGKTFVYNPAVFNKINFLLQEISGPRTPLEKETLKSPYYNYLNRPGVVKLNYLFPFFQDNPVYLNAINLLPYYTLNIFQPSEREYLDPALNRISRIKDKTPFFQTPEGQVMWDYFIQPMIIRDSNPPETPVGLFGQPLYPESASALEKYLAYPTRDIAGSVVPPLSGAAGFLTSQLPDVAKDYLPNYRWRQISYALQGKGSTGVPSKEPALQRTLRAMSSILGFPIQTLELRFSNKK